MKIFSWMRSRLNGKESNSKPVPESISNRVMHHDSKEEFSDWPNALLAIGTFGNNNLKDPEKSNIQLSLPSKQDHLENTLPEEFGEVDKELTKLLNKHLSPDCGEPEKLNYLTVQKLLDCLPEVEENKENRLHRSNSVVHGGGKDIRSEKKSSGIGKKSLRFLLKKVLLCRGGFAPNPMLRDPLPDPKLDNSRMEKLLRSMLHKKIYPQRSSPKGNTPKKYLDMPESESDDEELQEASQNTSKWVKTDSEYIVLEI